MTADTMSEAPALGAAPRALNATRPFYWSVRRELWENRAPFIAPLVVAALVVFGFAIGAFHTPHITGDFMNHDPDAPLILRALPFNIGAIALVATALIVAVFYCLGALHNERRDRSVLFWKSLPVSDVTTVASKVFIPLVVMPVVTLAVIVATQIVMLLLGSVILPMRGEDPAILWTTLPLVRMWSVAAYALAALVLWYAPVAAWLLLVGAWAKRAPFLWAVLPPLALALVERLSFGTGYVGKLISYRLNGGVAAAFGHSDTNQAAMGMPQIDPAGFFATPGLWAGLVFAVAALAACVWLRRYREPI